jgi:putative ABC transport system ATP-binding protein
VNRTEPNLVMEAVERTFRSAAGKEVHVLRDIGLAVDPGEFVALTGPSGSGKTTLLHLAGLLDVPTAGRITLGGADLTHATPDERASVRAASIGIVHQHFHLLPHRSAYDNVLFRFRYLRADPDLARRASLAALDRLGLSHIAHQPARLLSGGEMQRVAIARAIAHPPRLLLADEPTGNLDADAARVVMEAFRELHGEGHTLLMATHNTSLLRHASRRIEIDAGMIREPACA